MSAGSGELLSMVRETRQQLALSQHRDRAIAECIAKLEDLEQRLSQLPRVAILGEFNSGKTSLANLLLGACVLPTSVIANTRVPVVLRYAQSAAIFAVTKQGRHAINTPTEINALGDVPVRVEVHLPVDALRQFEVLDTPPEIDRELAGAPGQIVVWCTIANRAWTDSERRAWAGLPTRCRHNGLLVATHKDTLRSTEDLEKVGQRLRSLAGPMFRDVFFVTADEAALTDAVDAAAAFQTTGVEALVDRIGELAGAISDRRRRKAAMIIRRLVRRTMQTMGAPDLNANATSLLAKWKLAASKICSGADAASAHSAAEKLLKAFAEFTEGTVAAWVREHGQAGSRKKTWNIRHLDMGQLLSLSWQPSSEADEQFVRDLADDLTAALRIELVEATIKTPRGLYRKAQTALMSLAAAAADSKEDARRRDHQRAGLLPPPLPAVRLEPPPLPPSFTIIDRSVPASLTPRPGANPGAVRARAS